MSGGAVVTSTPPASVKLVRGAWGIDGVEGSPSPPPPPARKFGLVASCRMSKHPTPEVTQQVAAPTLYGY
eukprot:CAMPEP_0115183320 /NCGR_PEP_ID=MMETSP0270-20121206/8394_1 /TAXON_ID=71861 /ORGANISM="Scrippsiella trochoidea, Strain CCMP3099" /LENGTH=69 /DNA_ID=CAMNT_0002596387 /DNA_START=460 /DNA_END=669 /DNA_ORIENTATION=-